VISLLRTTLSPKAVDFYAISQVTTVNVHYQYAMSQLLTLNPLFTTFNTSCIINRNFVIKE
jgi:hypothetical protein